MSRSAVIMMTSGRAPPSSELSKHDATEPTDT
jgi:hypothetical protein